MSDSIVIIKSNEALQAFQTQHPNGYAIMNGDKGVGLIDALAERARNVGSDPNGWVELAATLGPFIHQASLK